MITFFSKFEAIESRIASYSCPLGVPSRVHRVRLRKCFLNHRRLQSTTGEGAFQADTYLVESDGRSYERSENEPVGLYSWDNRDKHRRTTSSTPSLKHNTTADRNHFIDVLKDFSNAEPTKDHQFEDAGKQVFTALRAGNPQSVLKALVGVAGKKGRYTMRLSMFLEDLPPSIFSEILRRLDPENFLNKYSELHKEFGPTMARRVGITTPNAIELDRGYLEFSKVFLDQAASIIESRCQNWPPILSDFRYLLKCARVTGDLNAAESIWQSMENSKGIIPDSECYNHLLATKCLDRQAKNDVWRFRSRIIPKNTDFRKMDNWIPYELSDHRLGPSTGGIKATTSLIFRKMVESGVSGNEETFCYMMIAMAREGDLASVCSILKRVWEIDVEALMADSPEAPAKELSHDSPFYPSNRLLSTIAHCFGINNQIPTALRTVDFVSRRYSLHIPVQTWNELLQWTFVISHTHNRKFKRHGQMISDGSQIPSLPLDSVSNLWQTMISEPYNIKPTMEMYNRLISNMLLRRRWGEVQYHIHAAYQLFKSDIKSLSRQLLILHRSRSRITSAEIIEKRLHQVYLGRLRVQRNRYYMHKWLKNLVRRGGVNMSNGHAWTTQNIPNLVRDWNQFLPHQLQYPVAMGIVTMNIKSEKMQTLRWLRANKPSIMRHEELSVMGGDEDALAVGRTMEGDSRLNVSGRIKMRNVV